MKKSLLLLFRHEFLIQNHKYSLIKHLVSYFVIFILASCLTHNDAVLPKTGITFSTIFFPLSIMSFSNFVLKGDLEDGFLEYLFICFNSFEIVFIKFLVYLSVSLISLICIIPIIIYFFQPDDLYNIIILISCFLLLITLINALVIFIGSLQCYFRNNINFLSSSILLLILPSLVISGIVLQNPENSYFVYILLGIDLILVPILLVLSSILLKNIYSID